MVIEDVSNENRASGSMFRRLISAITRSEPASQQVQPAIRGTGLLDTQGESTQMQIGGNSTGLEGERKYSINASDLIIRFGNILSSNAEVIVSSDDTNLSMSGGVSDAISSFGGTVIQNDAQKNVPAQLGDIVVTTAGALSQKYIFHCITVDYKRNVKDALEAKGLQEYILHRSIDKCLRMMPLLGIESIAFPTIGAGIANFSLEEIATCMSEIITDFLFSTQKQYHVEIYLFDQYSQKSIMDYMVFFENIAKRIENHKNGMEMAVADDTKVAEETSSQPFGLLAATTPQDEHKVFVSYSRKDVEQARIFCKMMDEMGISYWIDVNGKYSGNNFKEVLVDAIDTSQMLVFLSSKNSNQSSFVIKEIALAVASNKQILPIKLDDAPYAKSVRFDLSDIDWIEYSQGSHDVAQEKFRHCMQLYLKS